MAKGKFDALLEATASGGTAGFADEIDGAIGGAQVAAQDATGLWDFFERLEGSYEKERDASRRSRAESAERHPVITGVGEALGTGFGAAGMAAFGPAALAGRGALAAGGALEGLGRTEDNSLAGLTEASLNGAGSALVAGKVAEGVGNLAGKGVSKMREVYEGVRYRPDPNALETFTDFATENPAARRLRILQEIAKAEKEMNLTPHTDGKMLYNATAEQRAALEAGRADAVEASRQWSDSVLRKYPTKVNPPELPRVSDEPITEASKPTRGPDTGAESPRAKAKRGSR